METKVIVEAASTAVAAALIILPAGKANVAPLEQHESGDESAVGGQQNCPPPHERTVSNEAGLTR